VKVFDPLGWVLKDEKLALPFLRFGAIFPYLKKGEGDLTLKVFDETVGRVRYPPLYLKFLILLRKFLDERIIRILRGGFNLFSKRFIAGSNPTTISRKIAEYQKMGYSFSLDLLGEAVLSEKEADKYLEKYCQLLSLVSREIESDDLSSSLKLSAFYSQIDPFSPIDSARRILDRLFYVFEFIAKHLPWHFYLDAEERDLREIHFAVFKELFKEHGDRVRFVLQSYFKDSDKTLERLIELNEASKSDLWVRLVMGAYWDFEQCLSELRGWDSYVIRNKIFADRAFSELLRRGNEAGLIMVPATHNVSKIIESVRYKPKEIQLLFGLGEVFAKPLRKAGFKVRFYMPTFWFSEGCGAEGGLAYLLRRIVENTSQMNFLYQHQGRKMRVALRRLESFLKDFKKEKKGKREQI
jgi:RHH-type proline utilization regulon transcriptional repressor/proline dehydrogenase/delta 1-pyrroline-5-carboxylate dehydrogenase